MLAKGEAVLPGATMAREIFRIVGTDDPLIQSEKFELNRAVWDD